MKHSVIWKPSILLGVLFLSFNLVTAQSKYKESFKASKDMLVEVNTAYTNVIFETWNKDYVEVEAYVDNKDLSKEEQKEIFDNWDFEVLGNSKKVVVTSNPSHYGEGIGLFGGAEALKSLESLKALKELGKMPLLTQLPNFAFDFNFDIPKVPELEKFPKWPFSGDRPNLKNGDEYNYFYDKNKKSLSFDRGAYKKNKQAYVDKLNRKHNTNVSVRQVDNWLDKVDDWSKNVENVMDDWGEEFGDRFETQFGPEFEKKMEKWGEEFGEKFSKDMEKWGEEFGEQFGKDMEKWGEEFGKNMEEWAKQFEENEGDYSHNIIIDDDGNKNYLFEGKKDLHFSGKTSKTIIVRMPKGTKTDVNVRYGELKMANAYNVKATLNYSPLTANSIDGGETLINASYAPVRVNSWNNGALKVNYVEDCRLNSVSEIHLESNSSDVSINELLKTAMLSGSFGNLYVLKLAPNFSSVDVTLDNTDATLKIPNASFDFYYNGKKSKLSHPKSFNLTETKSFDRKLLKGFNKTNASGKTITINANYSNINVQ